jgi:hypothetical protein
MQQGQYPYQNDPYGYGTQGNGYGAGNGYGSGNGYYY